MTSPHRLTRYITHSHYSKNASDTPFTVLTNTNLSCIFLGIKNTGKPSLLGRQTWLSKFGMSPHRLASTLLNTTQTKYVHLSCPILSYRFTWRNWNFCLKKKLLFKWIKWTKTVQKNCVSIWFWFHCFQVQSVVWHYDEAWLLASGAFDQTVALLDCRTGI